MSLEKEATKKEPIELRKAFVSSIYETLDKVVSPTPYLEIKEADDKIGLTFLNGRGKLPSQGSTEVTILDIDIASLFFDNFHILYEGVTGVGKTYTSDALFGAIFGQDGHYTLRLSGGLIGNSALEPFTTTTIENGIPKTRIDHEKCKKYGAIFIDEINRGDSQEVFQVVDGKININGDSAYLGLPIPGKNRDKKLAIIAAMNPADSQHSSALELDLAGENRFLKFQYPNGVDEAASSQIDKRATEDLHKEFWKRFSEKTGLKVNWKEIYPLIADSELMKIELSNGCSEFIDLTLGYFGKDPLETFNHNNEMLKNAGYNARFNVPKNNELDKIRELQKTLKHGFVRRDLNKIYDLACLIGFIKSCKDQTYTPNVTLNDVAASIGIVLESKKMTGEESGRLMNLVNDGLTAYRSLRQDTKIADTPYGVRQVALQAAIHAGQNGFGDYIKTIRGNINRFNSQTKSIADATIRSRLLADLTVLEHFSKTYEKEIDRALKSDDAFTGIKTVFDANKTKASIYEHRLDSVFK